MDYIYFHFQLIPFIHLAISYKTIMFIIIIFQPTNQDVGLTLARTNHIAPILVESRCAGLARWGQGCDGSLEI